MLFLRKTFLPFFIAIFSITNISNSNSANIGISKARSKNPYIITNIFASAEEDIPSESKKISTIKANRIAFMVLLKNLGIEESFADQVSDEQIANTIYDTKIVDEVVSGNYYSAKFNISFLKSTVSELISKIDTKGIAKKLIAEGEEIFLVIPVQVENKRQILWEANNLWRKSFHQVVNISNTKNVIIPKGDYRDFVSVNLNTIKNIDFANFSSILNRYNATTIIVAYFEYDKIENKVNLTLDSINTSEIVRNHLSFVNSKKLSKNGLYAEVAQKLMQHIVGANEVKPKIDQADVKKDILIETQKSIIVDRYPLVATKNIPIEVKKNTFASGANQTQKMFLNVEISDLDDWLSKKSQIENMSFIKSLKLEEITKTMASTTIEYDASIKDIKKSFAKYGFLLRSNKGGQYFLSEK